MKLKLLKEKQLDNEIVIRLTCALLSSGHYTNKVIKDGCSYKGGYITEHPCGDSGEDADTFNIIAVEEACSIAKYISAHNNLIK